MDGIRERFRAFVAAYADFVVRRRGLVLVLAVLLLAAGASGLPFLKTQTTFRIWHHPDAPEVKDYDRMLETFGSDDTALIAFSDPQGILRNEGLAAIDRMTQALWRVEHVKRVDSLTNFTLLKTSLADHESPALAVWGDRIWVAGEAGAIVEIDRRTRATRRLLGHEGTVMHLAAGGDGKSLVSGGLDRQVIVWDLERGAPRYTLRGAPGNISALALSEDATRVYAGSHGAVLGWDVASGRRLFHRPFGEEFVTALATTSAGIWVASRTVAVIDPESGTTRQEWPEPGAFVTELLSARDGQRVFLGSEDGRVLALSSGAAPKVLQAAGPAAILSLAEGPSGALWVGTSTGTLLELAAESRPAAPLRAHRAPILDLAVAGDGAVFTASFDHDVAVTRPGAAPLTLGAHRAVVRRVMLAPSGRELYSVGDDAAVYVWRIDGSGAPVLADHFSRVELSVVEATSPIAGGEPSASLHVQSLLAHPVELVVSGVPGGRVDPGGQWSIEALRAGPRRSCTDQSQCLAGQSCDFEEGVCINPARVEAVIPGTQVRVWAGLVHLSPGTATTLRIPSEDAFSLEEVALSPLPSEATVGGLLAAHRQPEVKAALGAALTAADLAEPTTFLSPAVAARARDALAETESTSGARRVLGELAERKLAANRLPIEPGRLRETRWRLLRPPSPIAEGFVINGALDTTLVFVSLHQPDHEHALDRMVHLHQELDRLVAAEKPRTGYDYHLSGEVIMDTSFKTYAEGDMQRLGPVFAVVCAVLLALLFRRPAGVLLPMGAILMAIGFTMGTASWFGASINNMTGAVPQVIMACCLGDAVHLLTGWISGVKAGKSAPEAARETVRENFWPCTITAETTVVGFIALIPSEIGPISSFGWIAAIGAAAAFVFSFTVMPAVMSFLPVGRAGSKGPGGHGAADVSDRAEKLLERWGTWVLRRPRTVAAVVLGLTAIGGYGVAGVTFDTNPIKNFKPGTPFRAASEVIERKISGPVGVEIMIDTQEPRGLRKTAHLQKLAALQAHLEQSPLVTKVVGLPDIHRAINRAFNQDKTERYELPASDVLASAYYDAYTLSLPAGMELNNRVSEDESKTRLTVRMRSVSSVRVTEWQAETQRWIDQHLPGMKATISGKFLVYATMTNKLTQSFLWNVGSAVLMITLSMMLVLASVRLGFVSMFPNIVPGIWAIGMVSLAGVPLDVSIIVSLCVAIGVVVDDTIHFLAKYKIARRERSAEDALIDTFRHAGLPLSFTTVVLCSGFAIFMASDYQITASFGLTTTITFLAGVILDFTLTPALVKLLDGRRRVEVPASAQPAK